MSHFAKWVLLACILGSMSARAFSAESAASMPTTASMQEAVEEVEVGSTLENLIDAFNGESNAAKRYESYAQKADDENYPQVARVFRAASESEKVHAANHAKVITEMGGKAEAKIEAAEVKSTKENLEAAIRGESYEFKAMYPAFLKVARKDVNKDAVRTFSLAKEVEAGHAKIYQHFLDNLHTMKGVAGEPLFVCVTCGNTVRQSEMTFKKCPICFKPRETFKMIR